MIDIAAGREATCAVTAAGAARCWGSGRGEPVTVAVRRVREITVGGTGACALDIEGLASCWDTRRPSTVRRATDLRKVSAGDRHTCAPDTRGRAYCWDAVSGAEPVPVAGWPRPPGAVTGIRVRALDGGLRVDWSPPADLGSGTFRYLWVTTVDHASGCTLTVATAGGCALTGLRNNRQYDVAVLVRTGDGITMSEFVTASPAATARPAGRTGVAVRPDSGLSPVALVVLGTLLLLLGLITKLGRRCPGRRRGTARPPA